MEPKLENNIYYAGLISLIMVIAGIYMKWTWLFMLGMFFVSGVVGWVARGDNNGR